jgi:hypothetical protein
MVGHRLMVMVPYDMNLNLDAIEFNQVPIWIRVTPSFKSKIECNFLV